MKKLFTTTALLATMATSAIAAQSDTVYATITQINPRYESVFQEVPVTRCQDVQVPIYGQTQGNGASGGDVLGGMIIGGLLGKGATGNDKGAAIGAILGGVVAADNKQSKQVVTGYRTERQCTEVMSTKQVTVIKDYKIRFQWNGFGGTAYTFNDYRIGDRIPVEIRLRAK